MTALTIDALKLESFQPRAGNCRRARDPRVAGRTGHHKGAGPCPGLDQDRSVCAQVGTGLVIAGVAAQLFKAFPSKPSTGKPRDTGTAGRAGLS